MQLLRDLDAIQRFANDQRQTISRWLKKMSALEHENLNYNPDALTIVRQKLSLRVGMLTGVITFIDLLNANASFEDLVSMSEETLRTIKSDIDTLTCTENFIQKELE